MGAAEWIALGGLIVTTIGLVLAHRKRKASAGPTSSTVTPPSTAGQDRHEKLVEMLEIMGRMRVNSPEYGANMARVQALGASVADARLTAMLNEAVGRGDFVPTNPLYESARTRVQQLLADRRDPGAQAPGGVRP